MSSNCESKLQLAFIHDSQQHTLNFYQYSKLWIENASFLIGRSLEFTVTVPLKNVHWPANLFLCHLEAFLFLLFPRCTSTQCCWRTAYRTASTVACQVVFSLPKCLFRGGHRFRLRTKYFKTNEPLCKRWCRFRNINEGKTNECREMKNNHVFANDQLSLAFDFSQTVESFTNLKLHKF